MKEKNFKEIKLSKHLENGVEFSCQMCGNCCRGLNDGEVYLFREDIVRFAKFLKLKGKAGLRDFCRKYVKIVENTFYWKEKGAKRSKNYKFKTLALKFFGENEHCYFLKGNKCTVHEARAYQCKIFPWWVQNIESRKNFQEYAKKCPALSELKGKFYSAEEILKWANKEYELEKTYFLEMKKNNFDIFKVYKFLPEDIEDIRKK